ncbi:hypothetical protein CPB85DRAFT_1435725 [Mucidula mucida]|nr:hypothetical protein CPB85DRAFT_1435725 [Mucidula mucida]
MVIRAEDMLQRSGCALRRLTLHGFADGIDHISSSGSLIRQCVSLQELSLLRIEAGTESVTQLLSSVQSLPSLRALALDISYIRDFCAESQNAFIDKLLTFLESRRGLSEMPNGAVPRVASYTELESFTLHALAEGVFDFTDNQHQRIKALRVSGLLFYICRYENSDPRMY